MTIRLTEIDARALCIILLNGRGTHATDTLYDALNEAVSLLDASEADEAQFSIVVERSKRAPKTEKIKRGGRRG